ncbi:MAG: M50 family metallopeptidase [Bacillaceae bacterium]|nr:M50 family metallopeptidase [Bacillaceae bacterium]
MNNPVFGGVRVRIHPLFIVMMFGSVWTGYFIEMFTLFGLVVIHELGHVFVARAFAWKIRQINLLPFGGVAEVEEWGNTSPKEEVIVALAGPLLNGVMWVMALFFWKIGIWDETWTRYFMSCNLLIAGFNLIPVLPLDGGKVVQGFLSMGLPYRKAVYLTYMMSFTGIMLLFAGIFAESAPKINLFMIGTYLLVQNIMEYRRVPYQIMRFWMMKYERLKKGSHHWPSIRETVSPDIRVSECMKVLRKGRFHQFLIKSDRLKTFKMVDEQQVLQAYFEKKQPQREVSEIFMIR